MKNFAPTYLQLLVITTNIEVGNYNIVEMYCMNVHAAIAKSHHHDDESTEGSTQEAMETEVKSENGVEVTTPVEEKIQEEKEDQIWRRTERRSFAEGAYIARFEVLSARILPQSEGSNSKKFVLYMIQVRMECNEAELKNENVAAIERRYTELLNLFELLKKDHANLLNEITFPKKKLIGNFSPSLIEERSKAFETFLDYIVTVPALRDSEYFLEFLQGDELKKACALLDERRNEQAVTILENCFKILNKIYLDKSKPVLLLLCRLVAACTSSPIVLASAEQWASLALRRFEHVSDVETLVLYIPLLQTCVSLYNQKGKDSKILEERLEEMGKRGIKIKGTLSLQQTIHTMDPRSETA
uniref:CSON010671 protein n=1 Tax=Culicoides sonorensis TaxID=179676 RepID=A0A336M4Q0_CULSO